MGGCRDRPVQFQCSVLRLRRLVCTQGALTTIVTSTYFVALGLIAPNMVSAGMPQLIELNLSGTLCAHFVSHAARIPAACCPL